MRTPAARIALLLCLCLGLGCAGVVLGLAGPVPAAAGADTPSGLSLSLSLRHPGEISGTLRGPAGASVSVGEDGGADPVTVTLPAGGSLALGDLARWSCSVRVRSFTATLVPSDGTTGTTVPSPSAVSHASVRTPSCVHRVRWSLRGTTTASGITLEMSDRWELGGVPVRVCLAAPLDRDRCRQVTVPRGGLALALSTPRPGGWRIGVSPLIPGAARGAVLRWVANPGHARLRLLAAGDSEMELVGTYIDGRAAPLGVQGVADAHSSTGLENEWFFNWYHEARRDVAREHPQVTVLFMGANAGFTIQDGHRAVDCCSPAWSALYARAVERLSDIFEQGSRGVVLWTTLPTPSSGSFHQIFDAVNAAERTAAAAQPGRIGLIDANGFFTPGDVYRNTMTWGGSTFTIHQSDGLHLSTPADWAHVQLVLDGLRAQRLIR